MRTFEDIKNQIIADKEVRLPQANSSSASAIYMAWINIMALAIYSFEQIFEKDKLALQDLTERRRYGTLDWYATEAKKFQFNHQLVFNSDTGQFYYDVEDISSQIIVQCAVEEDSASGVLTMVSDNKEYTPFEIPQEEIEGIALVVGVIRLE